MRALLFAGAVSLLVALVGTPVLIGWLRARGIGQQIREDGPEGHRVKAGTPTMGGLMIVGGAAVGYVAAHTVTVFTLSGLLTMGVICAATLVGLVDDWISVRHQRSLGLNKRAKFGAQLVVATIFALLCVRWAQVTTTLSFTRYTSPGINIHEVGWVVLAVFIILASSNAVNLTDGLDGLAAGSAAFAFSAFTIIGFWQLRHTSIYAKPGSVPPYLDMAIIAVAMIGGCAGFLWWNAAPARIIMGDTGSLAIGTALGALALLENVQLLLLIIGGLYVLETLSVMIQVASFRLFHRRVFRMAPIHHHFELAGWPETTVVIRFWIFAGLCAGLGLGIFYADFLSLGLGN
jgi:phospho-N-acetylmuramoyl-pentapeptide-transferase